MICTIIWQMLYPKRLNNNVTAMNKISVKHIKHHHSPDLTPRRAHRVRLLTSYCSQSIGGLLCPHTVRRIRIRLRKGLLPNTFTSIRNCQFNCFFCFSFFLYLLRLTAIAHGMEHKIQLKSLQTKTMVHGKGKNKNIT